MVTKEQHLQRPNINRDAWIQINSQSNEKYGDQIVLTFPSINSAIEHVFNCLAKQAEVNFLKFKIFCYKNN